MIRSLDADLLWIMQTLSLKVCIRASGSVRSTFEMRRKHFTGAFVIVSCEKLVFLPYPIKLYNVVRKDTASIKNIPQL